MGYTTSTLTQCGSTQPDPHNPLSTYLTQPDLRNLPYMGLTLAGLYTVLQEETIKQHTSRMRDRDWGGQLQDLPVLSSPSSLSSTITHEMKTPWPSMSCK
eukprot:TRINITY_DN10767_c1_g2_i1.p1 TRINITY_DN10767_c1_g2~~TRINITY_DN10767_c1_g2_i1.p1  ORF type:complete len:100 (+),score=7.93 TRINITY_DN10767_c1_g2_i1:139-438(+)